MDHLVPAVAAALQRISTPRPGEDVDKPHNPPTTRTRARASP